MPVGLEFSAIPMSRLVSTNFVHRRNSMRPSDPVAQDVVVEQHAHNVQPNDRENEPADDCVNVMQLHPKGGVDRVIDRQAEIIEHAVGNQSSVSAPIHRTATRMAQVSLVVMIAPQPAGHNL